MTQEEKQLLLKDLCARLPYGVIIDSKKYNETPYRRHYLQRLVTVRAVREEVVCVDVDDYPDPKCHTHKLEYCKPYLRPMESMTEDEDKEYCSLKGANPAEQVAVQMDYLLSRHLDVHGLISMGLALPAKDGMYEKNC